MTVKDIMLQPVLTSLPGNSVKDAHALMRENGFRHLPIIDGEEKIVGILTEHAIRNIIILYRSKSGQKEINDLDILDTFKTEQVLNKKFLSLAPSAPIKDAAALLKENKNGCILVLDERQVIGIVTAIDILKYVAEKKD